MDDISTPADGDLIALAWGKYQHLFTVTRVSEQTRADAERAFYFGAFAVAATLGNIQGEARQALASRLNAELFEYFRDQALGKRGVG